MSRAIPAVVLGATGYVGGELLRLLATHPVFTVRCAVSESRAGDAIGAVFPHLAPAYGKQSFVARDRAFEDIEDGAPVALFSAAPHGASAKAVQSALTELGARGCDVHIVDASADFRFATLSGYEAVYGAGHGAPDLLPQFSSGLPEHVEGVPTPHVGNPGCFATTMLLASVPLLRSALTDGNLFASAVTGSTGSGREAQPGTHHPERHSNLYAYKPLAHRHAPEVVDLAERASGQRANLHFVPHSGPFARGIHLTLQARAADGVTLDDVRAAFRSAYDDAPFVELVDGTPRLKHVVASNRAQIGVALEGGTIAVLCVIDNLVKGAAGGAVQWMNRLWGLPETDGLLAAAPAWT